MKGFKRFQTKQQKEIEQFGLDGMTLIAKILMLPFTMIAIVADIIFVFTGCLFLFIVLIIIMSPVLMIL